MKKLRFSARVSGCIEVHDDDIDRAIEDLSGDLGKVAEKVSDLLVVVDDNCGNGEEVSHE